jgi:signal transduction histidine kinase
MSDEPVTSTGEDPPGRTALRAAGLVGLIYVVAAATHPGVGGSQRAALVLTVATGLSWIGWLVSRFLRIPLLSHLSLCALAISGGVLVLLSPVGVAVLGVAALSAASVVELAPAAAIAALGIAATAVGVAVTDASPALVGGAATGAAAGVAIGITMRQQQERVAHAARLALAEQRTQLADERAEVLAERNRIAREVHDVLAHTLSALSVQIEALDSLVVDNADVTQVRGALGRSRRLVIEGLDETRRAVRVLRDEPVAVADQVAALAGEVGAEFDLRGAPRPLAAAPGLALLRVAQESLTNARKHAPGVPVTVALTFADRCTSLTVENGLPATASPSLRQAAVTVCLGCASASNSSVAASLPVAPTRAGACMRRSRHEGAHRR